jgi:hypothetical protein
VKKINWGLTALTGFTLIWVIGWGFHAIQSEFFSLNLNEQGEFLAGVFAPIAFVWAVAAVIYQRNEISLNKLEMKNQTAALTEQSRIASEALTFEFKRSKRAELNKWLDTQPLLIYAGRRSGIKGTATLQVKLRNTAIYNVEIVGRHGDNPQRHSVLEIDQMISLGIPHELEREQLHWDVSFQDHAGNPGHIVISFALPDKYHSELTTKPPEF